MVLDLKFLLIVRNEGSKEVSEAGLECLIVVLPMEKPTILEIFSGPDYFLLISKNAFINPNLIGQNWV